MKYWIWPSQGYAGIDPGMVEVIGKISRKAALKVFRNCNLETYDCEGYEPQTYVVYKYDFRGERNVQVIPLDIFEEHTEKVEW